MLSGGDTHTLLVEGGRGDPFDRHVFACALVIGLADPEIPATKSLGLAPDRLGRLLQCYFPRAVGLIAIQGDPGEDALEEPDLRELLLEHRSRGVEEEDWLAAIVARRSKRS